MIIRHKIRTFASTISFKHLKIVILDECDYLTPNAQAALRNVMETFSKHCRFILTCNYVERVIDPIQSRCQSYKIMPPKKSEVARHVVKILTNEQVSHDLDDVAAIVTSGYPDIRRVINSLQRQTVSNKLKIDKSSIIQNNYKLQLIELLASRAKFSKIRQLVNNYKIQLLEMLLDREDHNKVRQLVADNSLTDYSELYRLLYDEIDHYTQSYVPECIIAIAESQHRDVHIVDKEINFMSAILKIQQIIKEEK